MSFQGDIDDLIFEQFPGDLEQLFSHVDNDKIVESVSLSLVIRFDFFHSRE